MDFLNKHHIRDFNDKGFFVVDQKVSTTWRNQLIDELEKHHAENAKWFQHDPHLKSDLFATFIKHALFVEVCQKLIGENADLHWNLISNKPARKGKSFQWHQDALYGITEPEHYVTCWVALDDASVDNGCLWMIPESHRAGRFEHVSLKETEDAYAGLLAKGVNEADQIPIKMKAGDVAIFDSHIVHRSGPNLSDKSRRSYVCAYHHCDLKYLTEKGMKGIAFPILRDNKVVGD